ncbi:MULTISPECIES: hypothetical protein [Dellaglioa]|nr:MULTISPECIES: hypothetical protein [Dellaglioa]MCZ2491624.1 hypothetical protein [Dellaglioa carnosa]MCZ2494701.1 hypothetical protein [Dellaglioa carnosa]MDK1717477.1 hypothetical protein [Dellaglioa algida]MDK1720782.1 hypothetical protein [Dellaglioa algida]MDK1722451.1 hypothetical protein [Dellaglioa algida]
MSDSKKYPISPYFEIKSNHPWYIDAEIEELMHYSQNLKTVLQSITKNENINKGWRDEDLETNVQLLLLIDYEELEVWKYPVDLSFGKLSLKEDVISFNENSRIALYFEDDQAVMRKLGYLPKEDTLQAHNIMAELPNYKIATYLTGGPYKKLTFEDNELEIDNGFEEFRLNILIY